MKSSYRSVDLENLPTRAKNRRSGYFTLIPTPLLLSEGFLLLKRLAEAPRAGLGLRLRSLPAEQKHNFSQEKIDAVLFKRRNPERIFIDAER